MSVDSEALYALVGALVPPMIIVTAAAGAGCYVGTVLDRVDVGDHVAFLIEPVDVLQRRWDAPQLGLQAVMDMGPGHEA